MNQEEMRIQEETRSQEESLEQKQEAAKKAPDKREYMEKILALSAEDQAFLDGYLFAKVTSTRPA